MEKHLGKARERAQQKSKKTMEKHRSVQRGQRIVLAAGLSASGGTRPTQRSVRQRTIILNDQRPRVRRWTRPWI